MRYEYLKKDDLGKFIEELKKSYRVVGPVKKENSFIFDDIRSVDDLTLEYLPTILPPKKYFFPQREKLGTFKMGENKMSDTFIDIEPTVILGAHTCDIDGLECLDAVFYSDPADPYYKKRKKSVILIGYECMFPCDECATCLTMDTHIPKAGYDVMISDAGDKFILHINSAKGDELLKGCKVCKAAEDDETKAELKKLRSEKLGKFENVLDPDFQELPKLFDESYDSPVWEEVGKKCVSCGNCTAVCPTCYCFDIYDSVELDMSGGDRKRVWDSCQLETFAEVAGGENFREERASRQRHRFYRKFSYPMKKFNKFFCTGCGRCTRACMAGISLIETVNSLKKEK